MIPSKSPSVSREVGAFLSKNPPNANLNATITVFERKFEQFRVRAVLNEGKIRQRVQYMMEVLMQVRKHKYTDNPILKVLDLMEDEQITHQMQLDEADKAIDEELDVQDSLSKFFYFAYFSILQLTLFFPSPGIERRYRG